MADAEFSFSPSNYFGVTNDFMTQLEYPFTFMNNRFTEWKDRNNALREMYVDNQRVPERLSETRLRDMNNRYDIQYFDRTKNRQELADQLLERQTQYNLDNFDRDRELEWKTAQIELQRRQSELDKVIETNAAARIDASLAPVLGETPAKRYRRYMTAIDSETDLSADQKARMKLAARENFVSNLTTYEQDMKGIEEAYNTYKENAFKIVDAYQKSKDKAAAYPKLIAELNTLRGNTRRSIERQFTNIDSESIRFAIENGWIDPSYRKRYGMFEDVLSRLKTEGMSDIADAYWSGMTPAQVAEAQANVSATADGSITRPSKDAKTVVPMPPTSPTVAPAEQVPVQESSLSLPEGVEMPEAPPRESVMADQPPVPDKDFYTQQALDQFRTRAENIGIDNRVIDMIEYPITITTPEAAMEVQNLLMNSDRYRLGIKEIYQNNPEYAQVLSRQVEKYRPVQNEGIYKYVGPGFDNSFKDAAEAIVKRGEATEFADAMTMLQRIWPGSELLAAAPVNGNFQLSSGVSFEAVESALGNLFGETYLDRLVSEGADINEVPTMQMFRQIAKLKEEKGSLEEARELNAVTDAIQNAFIWYSSQNR